MDLFPRSLRRRLSRAIASGELKRQDTLGQAGGKPTEAFPCDSLDLIELIMGIEDAKHRKPRTTGDLIDLLKDEKSRAVASRAPGK